MHPLYKGISSAVRQASWLVGCFAHVTHASMSKNYATWHLFWVGCCPHPWCWNHYNILKGIVKPHPHAGVDHLFPREKAFLDSLQSVSYPQHYTFQHALFKYWTEQVGVIRLDGSWSEGKCSCFTNAWQVEKYVIQCIQTWRIGSRAWHDTTPVSSS